MKIEFHAWPQLGNGAAKRGVLAIDLETGTAVFVNSEPYPERNQKLAAERLLALLPEVDWML